jgi:hypothetical protein
VSGTGGVYSICSGRGQWDGDWMGIGWGLDGDTMGEGGWYWVGGGRKGLCWRR